MYHCHHSKGPGGEIPVADEISLGSLWNRSGHSGHPGANISRSLSVERTDRAGYSIFKVQKVLFTIHAKYEIFFVGCHSFFKSSLQACGSATGFGESPQICVWISKRYASKTYWTGKVILCIPLSRYILVFTAIVEHLFDLYHRHTIFIPPGYFSHSTTPFVSKPPYQLWYL